MSFAVQIPHTETRQARPTVEVPPDLAATVSAPPALRFAEDFIVRVRSRRPTAAPVNRSPRTDRRRPKIDLLPALRRRSRPTLSPSAPRRGDVAPASHLCPAPEPSPAHHRSG